jgi:hypothetical protein
MNYQPFTYTISILKLFMLCFLRGLLREWLCGEAVSYE